MHVYPNERIGLFIDGANLHATAQALGFEIGFDSLLAYYREQGLLIRAQYYTTVSEDEEYSSIRPLLDWLDYNGFTVITKPTKAFRNSIGNRKLKGSTNVDLTVDAMMLAPTLDHIVLFTGDGDFRALVKVLQEMGREVSVVSTLGTQPAMIADELRRQADHFIDLTDLKEFIIRDSANRPSPRQYRPETARTNM